MDNIKVGSLIKELRIKKSLTQKQLAEKLSISDKAVSKWERGLGAPDISLITDIGKALGVNSENILNGDLTLNEEDTGNMRKSEFFVCPECGSISVCTGNSSVLCCGRNVEMLIPQKATEAEKLNVEKSEDEWYITSEHPMQKDNYISFAAFLTGQKLSVIKQYPEWNFSVRLKKSEHGTLLWYSKKGGLKYQLI